METAIKSLSGQGLEVFSSPGTWDAIVALLGKNITAEFLTTGRNLFKSQKWEFQWLGVSIGELSRE